RFEGNPRPRDGVECFDESVHEPLPVGDEVDAERIFIAVDARPHDAEIYANLLAEFERPLRTINRLAADFRVGVGQRSEFEVAVVEQQRNYRQQPDAGVALELLPEVDVVFVDFVRVVGLEGGESVVLQACGNLESLLERKVPFVAAVESAVRRRKEPDTGGELEVDLEILERPEE